MDSCHLTNDSLYSSESVSEILQRSLICTYEEALDILALSMIEEVTIVGWFAVVTQPARGVIIHRSDRTPYLQPCRQRPPHLTGASVAPRSRFPTLFRRAKLIPATAAGTFCTERADGPSWPGLAWSNSSADISRRPTDRQLATAPGPTLAPSPVTAGGRADVSLAVPGGRIASRLRFKSKWSYQTRSGRHALQSVIVSQTNASSFLLTFQSLSVSKDSEESVSW